MTQQTISLSEIQRTKIAIADLIREIDYLELAEEVNLLDLQREQLSNAKEHLDTLENQEKS